MITAEILEYEEKGYSVSTFPIFVKLLKLCYRQAGIQSEHRDSANKERHNIIDFMKPLSSSSFQSKV